METLNVRLGKVKVKFMAFDLSQVLAQASQASAEGENSGSRERLIYPQDGKINVRILFNPKSQVVIRKFDRHTVNGTKVPCLSQYGTDCPVCKVIGDIKNAKGFDMYQAGRKTRGICYAEYVSSDYRWDKPEDEPKPGEIIMLMFPWTIYQDLNRIISQAGENLAQIVASNVGYVISIEKYTENKQIKYKASIDPFQMNHQTRNNDQEYNDLLMGLDSLNDKYVPIEINDDIIAKNKEVAEQLSREYLNPVQTTQPNVGQMGTNLGGLASQQNSMMNQGSMNSQQMMPQSTQDAQGNWYDLVNGQWVLRSNQNNQMNSMNQMNNQGMMNQGNTGMNLGGIMNNSANTNQNSGKPACYGKHEDPSINANQCMLCPNEAECQANSIPFH